MRLQFTPFKGKLPGYSLCSFRQDAYSAFIVALFAIPQAIAYSLLANLPPTTGLFCAIFGAIFTASWCSTQHLVSGPSTGISILLQATIADILVNYFPNLTPAQKPEMALHILMQLVLLIGAIQIFLACFQVNKLLQFVSRSVMLGYFSGVAIAIIVSQMGNFLGIPQGAGGNVLDQIIYLSRHLLEFNSVSLGLGVFCLFFLSFLKKRFPLLPDALFMIIIAGLIGYGVNRWGEGVLPSVPTLNDVGSSFSLPNIRLPVIDIKLINKILPQAIALALLGILEVFSTSRAISTKSGQKVDINQDVLSIGLSNFFLSFFRFSMPVSGSMSRSMIGYNTNAKTYLSPLLSGVFVFLLVFVCFPLISQIPMVALAALLLISSKYLVQRDQVKLCFKATKEDALVFLLTLGSCLVFTLDVAFFIGISISIASYLKKAATPHFVEFAFNEAGRLTVIHPTDKKHRKIRIIGIAGELFFANADILQNALHAVAEDPYVKVLVLRLHGVYHMDASMCFAIQRLHHYLHDSKRHLVVSGITKEVWRVFYRSTLATQIGTENLFLSDESQPQLSTWKACLRAQELEKKGI